MISLCATAVPAIAGLSLPMDAFAKGSRKDYFISPSVGDVAPLVMEPAPKSIVTEGAIKTGWFDAPPSKMNLGESRLFERGTTGLLEWVGAGISHPDWYFGLIVVDAHKAALAVFYGVNLKGGAGFSHTRIAPRRRVAVTDSMWAGTTSFKDDGFSVVMNHRLGEGRHEVAIDIKASGKNPAVKGEIVWGEDLSKQQPMVMMAPLPKNKFLYNHKAQMPIAGRISIGGTTLDFDPKRDLANMDEVRAFGSPKLSYRWFNGAGFDASGAIVGFNLSQSEQRSDPRWSENCLWVGNELFRLPKVNFTVPSKRENADWRAADDSGVVELSFHPDGGKPIGAGPFGNYVQKCGRYKGTISDGRGLRHEIADYYGCAEDMDVL